MSDEKNAAETFDRAASANRTVLALAYQRLEDIKAHLEEGDFMRANVVLSALAQKIGMLSQVHSNASLFGNVHAIQVQDLKVGDVLADLGTVTKVEGASDHRGGVSEVLHFHVTLDAQDEVLCLPRDTEILLHAEVQQQ